MNRQAMGRPKLGKKRKLPVTITVDPDNWQLFIQIANNEGTTASRVLDNFIAECISESASD